MEDVKYFVQELNPNSKNQRFIRFVNGVIVQVFVIVRGKHYILFFPVVRLLFLLLLEHLFPCQPKFFWIFGFDVLVQWVLNLSLP